MKFKTPQAQEAYAELLRELGTTIREVEDKSKAQELRASVDAPSIALSTAYKVAEIRMKGIELAIRAGNDIDIQWGCLMALESPVVFLFRESTPCG